MRSYTNRQGEKIIVSEEHLNMAIRIKKELQKSSPSRKASLRQLVSMMEKEGFYDADSNESYRCMLKAYQKAVGELPQAHKYAEMVSEGKIESIKELVGEVAFEKRENQQVLKDLNKLKREVIDYTLIAEQIGNAFKRYNWSEFKFNYEPIDRRNKNAMLVCLSDLHIGALVDTDVNKYDYSVAKERMQKYLDRVIEDIKKNNVSEVYLMNLGDVIENPYMHNLAYSCEFTLAEQITRASDIIIKFIIGLSVHVNVTVSGIAGNHDRLSEDKHKSLDGDHAVKGVNYAIETFIENSEIERVKYVQAKDYEHSILINGLNILALHGDLDSKDDKSILSKHSTLKSINYNIIVMGHYHTRELKELGDDKVLAVSGSLKGADNYSLNKLRKVSSASQMYVIINEFGEYDFKWVTLN